MDTEQLKQGAKMTQKAKNTLKGFLSKKLSYIVPKDKAEVTKECVQKLLGANADDGIP